MAFLNQMMLQEFASRREASAKVQFGFDWGILLQCDFSITIKRRNSDFKYESDNWIIDSVDIKPATLEWGNDAETFGSPMPQITSSACTITFLTKSVNPFDLSDKSIGSILFGLYESQFDSTTGLLQLPSPERKIDIMFNVIGALQNELGLQNETPVPLFELQDVKFGAPRIASDPKSLNPMGITLPFAYRNTRWRSFEMERGRLANHQSDADSILKIKL